MFWALVLIVLGFMFLGVNVDLISSATFSVLWPLVMIFFGVYILMRGKDCWHGSIVKKRKK